MRSQEWSSPDQPWTGTQLPVDDVDIALFNAATKVNVRNAKGRTGQ